MHLLGLEENRLQPLCFLQPATHLSHRFRLWGREERGTGKWEGEVK